MFIKSKASSLPHIAPQCKCEGATNYFHLLLEAQNNNKRISIREKREHFVCTTQWISGIFKRHLFRCMKLLNKSLLSGWQIPRDKYLRGKKVYYTAGRFSVHIYIGNNRAVLKVNVLYPPFFSSHRNFMTILIAIIPTLILKLTGEHYINNNNSSFGLINKKPISRQESPMINWINLRVYIMRSNCNLKLQTNVFALLCTIQS